MHSFLLFRRCDQAFLARVKSLQTLPLFLCGLLLSSCASVDAMRRVEVDFDYVAQIAEDLASRPYRAPEPLPPFLRELDYDQYRKIQYNPKEYLWKEEGLPFGLGFYHPGFLHQDSVKVHEFTATHEQRIRYLSEFFLFEDPALKDRMPSSLDYAGLRLSFSKDDPSDYREIVSFLGASYFRGTGWDTRYGASARGLAVNSGLGVEEEFPRFVEVWLGKPAPDSESVVMYALLDGPSVTGAYEFVIKPGDSTVMDVKAKAFLRQSVESFGVAPLTSMFWRGENRNRAEEDYRPEVHDSDGLVILERDDDPIWRQLDIGSTTRLSYFSVDQTIGFGLMQRDRDFASYQDLEADYHKRPSVWIEPKGDWGRGFVKLVELPTRNEFEDNVVAFWEPAVLPEKGASVTYEYKMHWTPKGAPGSYPETKVKATRLGKDPSYPGTEVFVVDFDGLRELGDPEIVTVVDGAAKLLDERVVWNPYSETWRVLLRLEEQGESGIAELRCQLIFPGGEDSEIWAYQWTR